VTQGAALRGVPPALPAGTHPRASSDASVSATDGMLAVRRAVLWAILASKLLASWGVRWDIQWHVRIGRDSFWIAPHVMTYAGVSLVVLLSFGVLVWETYVARIAGHSRGGQGTMRVLGLTGTRGYHVAAWGISVTVLAAPIDDLWHRLFGLDVTIWSPPHLMGFLGGMLNTIGCLLIALEAYPPQSLARVAALTVSGAWLYGTLDRVLEPAPLVAYQHGGARFYTYVILAALLLPLALVVTPRLTGRRSTPIALLLVVAASGLVGGQIARAGFAWLQPVSVIDAEIAKDPTSPIALAHEIARKNGTVPAEAGRFLMLVGLIPAVVMMALDPRRRAVGASVGWAVALFVIYGAILGGSPAFHPMAPDAAATALALGVTVAAAILGGLAARQLSDHLAARASGSA
jgi:hypothetical protein